MMPSFARQTVVIRSRERTWYEVAVMESFQSPWRDRLYDLAGTRQLLLCYDTHLPAEKIERIVDDIAAFSPETPVTCPLRGGEDVKSFDNLARILEIMENADIKRDALVLSVGGGSIGDVAGFAASVWNRGIPWCVIPTTLLSQCDSAIGGKVGVNLHRIKNRVGNIHQPCGVICILEWLDSLTDDEYRSGIGEVIKYGLGMDSYIWEILQHTSSEIRARDRSVLRKIVHRCIALKAWYISLDEHDRGMRHILNLGHTFGHAVESATPGVLHGDAVALGLLAATRTAIALNIASPDMEGALLDLLTTYGFRFALPTQYFESALDAIRADKKHPTGGYTVIVPVVTGRSRICGDIPFEFIRDSLKSLYTLQ